MRIQEDKGHLKFKNDSSANSGFTSPSSRGHHAPSLCRNENEISPKTREISKTRPVSSKLYSQVRFYKQNYEIGMCLIFQNQCYIAPPKKFAGGATDHAHLVVEAG